MRAFIVATVSCLLVMLYAFPALAHGVRVFGYVENGFIKGEGYFAGGVKAQGSMVELLDASGKVLATTKTDEAGTFSIKLPAADPPLKLVLKAGPGHQGDYTLTAEDLGQKAEAKAAPAAPAQALAQAPTVGISAAGLEAAVNRALEAKLAPINRRLAELADKQGVSLQDVMAGIGYILGIFGIAAYMMSRRKAGS